MRGTPGDETGTLRDAVVYAFLREERVGMGVVDSRVLSIDVKSSAKSNALECDAVMRGPSAGDRPLLAMSPDASQSKARSLGLVARAVLHEPDPFGSRCLP
ncbi:MAG: hypothetical protein H6806_11885 [Planctomycetes bacterium]|nr:hypothetical protein [Planctomycetota bacterium]